MKKRTPIDSEALIVEIRRYLAAVEVFRAAGCEPAWRPELEGSDPVIVRIGAYGQTATATGP